VRLESEVIKMSHIVFSKAKPRIVDNPKWTEKPGNTRAINKRVEELGALDDRRKFALANRDKAALLELAAEYLMLGRHGGCPTMANIITQEAEGL
jgi:hypothetical protein